MNAITRSAAAGSRIDTSAAHAAFLTVRDYLASQVIDQHSLVERLLIALLSDGHLLVEGPPGLAKTRAAAPKDSAAKEPHAAHTAPAESNSRENRQSAPQMGSAADRQQQLVASNEPPRTEGAVTNTRLTQNEQTLSLDQWLRRIPDDPAELLRRKFLLEHTRRQGPDSQ